MWSRNLNKKFTLGDCLFGAVKLIKSPGPDKYEYSDYCIEFDAGSQFSLPSGEWDKNVIFGVNNNLSVYADNRKKLN